MLSTLNVRGDLHNSCEDSIAINNKETYISGGIFDGCSTGIKSHWASQTMAYLFGACLDPTTDIAAVGVYHDLISFRNVLHLTEQNFLSTCLLFFFDKLNRRLSVRVFGDGFYYVNDNEFEIEQDNTPKYFGYLLRDKYPNLALCREGLERYPVKIYHDVSSFRICSDGIKSIGISQFKDPKIKEPLSLLFHPPTSENYLQRQWNILKRDGYTISDDLTIISYVKD